MQILEKDHYTAFGMITHFYASVEFGIRAALAGMLEIGFLEALVITEPYSASTLKNVAKSAAKESALSTKHQEKVIQIVGEWSSFASLRNAVAHNRWQRGERPRTCRPVGIDIRSGKAKWIVSEKSRDWTPEELVKEAEKIAKLNARLQEFMEEAGLFGIIDSKDGDGS